MQKIVRNASVEAAALPPAYEPCFDLMEQAGRGASFALFGGALRDSRYWQMHNLPQGKINDYDIRMIIPEGQVTELAKRLGTIANRVVQIAKSAGTGLPLYRIHDYYGADLDISFRSALPESDAGISVQDRSAGGFSESQRIAHERAANAVIGISGIAMDSEGGVWETPQHLADCEQRTLTVFPRDMYPYPTEPRVTEYLEHLQSKFPDHIAVEL